MFDHVHLRVSDLESSTAFYGKLLEPLGIPLLLDLPHLKGFANLALSADGPVSANTHVAFVAGDRAAVDAFHAAGLAAGGTDNGAPGVRAYGPPTMETYAAYVLDLDGNNIEAVLRTPKG
ncbi:MAG: VOC family protein [Solirubrobacteraceae bacterium]|nr:VOC family protein [Solirubrobacteraceae bacterium]